MGNCLVHQEKLIKVIKPDGKILEYKSPTLVQQVLSDFSGFAVSESLDAFHYLLPNIQLIGGKFYYLIPLPLSLPLASPKGKKKVRFSVPEEENKQEKGLVRIKVIISKQELQEMLQQNGGIFSVNHMVSKLQQAVQKTDTSDKDDDNKSWKPVLESIPELELGETLL